MHTQFDSVNLKGRDHLGHQSVNERIILKCIVKKFFSRNTMLHIFSTTTKN
jgi:hypothetical protein